MLLSKRLQEVEKIKPRVDSLETQFEDEFSTLGQNFEKQKRVHYLEYNDIKDRI